jgi:YVTN family beta-propeller protein
VSTIDSDADYRSLATDPLRPYVYLNESGNSDIDVFNVHTESRVATLSGVVDQLLDMEVSQDGRWLFAADAGTGGNRIVRFDLDLELDGVEAATAWAYPGSLQYGFTLFENNGKLLLASGEGRIFDAETGREYTASPIIGPNDDGVYLDAALHGNVLCGVDRASGPMTLTCWDVFYDLEQDRVETGSRGRLTTGTNGRDVAVSRDGSRAYLAQSSSDDFTVVDTSTLSVLTTLEGDSFPVAVEVGPDDAIHAAAFVSDDDRDFWVYEPGDYKRRLQESVSDEGDGIRARQVGVAADGRATVILSDRPETLIVRDY